MKIVIYGAQGVALGANKAIKIVHPEIKIECFLVTAMGNNASILGGITIFIINLVGANFGFHIGLNIFTSIIIGLLGLPGAVCLIIVKLLIG